jgi:hypothetical protein
MNELISWCYSKIGTLGIVILIVLCLVWLWALLYTIPTYEPNYMLLRDNLTLSSGSHYVDLNNETQTNEADIILQNHINNIVEGIKNGSVNKTNNMLLLG